MALLGVGLGSVAWTAFRGTPQRDTWADCATTWVAGNHVADQAVGCTDSTGARERYRALACADGSRLLAWADEWWTVDGRVSTGSDDEFARAVRQCRGS